MTEAKPRQLSLNAALAAFQADLPRIAKDATADTGSYKYDYADLATVSEKVMPLLGKHGLAFTAFPSLNHDGKFVLAYSLVHSSGEERSGVYPLPEKGTPQQIGSAITYGRRYCLCAVIGVAPGGDDDDGHSAPKLQRFAHTDAEHERLVPGQSVEDRNGRKAERVKGKAPDDEWTAPPETDQDWFGRIETDIKTFKTDDEGEVLRRRVVEKTEAGGCTKDDAEKLRTLIRARRQALKVEDSPAEETADV